MGGARSVFSVSGFAAFLDLFRAFRHWFLKKLCCTPPQIIATLKLVVIDAHRISFPVVMWKLIITGAAADHFTVHM